MISHKKEGNVSPKASGAAKHNSVLREENGAGAAAGATQKVTKDSTSNSKVTPVTGK